MFLSTTYLQGSVMAAVEQEKQAALLETYNRIIQFCSPFIAHIFLLIQRLHKLYYPGSCGKSSLVELCDTLVQISDSSCATS